MPTPVRALRQPDAGKAPSHRCSDCPPTRPRVLPTLCPLQEALQALVDEVHHIVAALHQMGLRSKADIHALQVGGPCGLVSRPAPPWTRSIPSPSHTPALLHVCPPPAHHPSSCSPACLHSHPQQALVDTPVNEGTPLQPVEPSPLCCLQGLADAALEQSTFGSTNQDHCARCHKPAGLQVLVPQACVHWPPDTPDTLHSVASTAPTALVCLRNVERRGITLQQAAGWRRAPLPAALGPLPTPVFLNMHRRCPLPLTGQRGDRGRAALLHRPTVPCACRERHGRRRAEAGVPVKSTTGTV